MYNKLLDHQLHEHLGKTDQVPENITRLLNVVSRSYDEYENDRKTVENSFVLSSKEITERNSDVEKRREDELEKAHTQLKILFENIEEIFYSVDVAKLKIVQISAACEKVYGYTPAEFMADPDLWYSVILPEDIDIVHGHFKELYEGKMVTGHYRILHKDKSIRWLESKIVPTLDQAGQLMRLDGVTNDITGRKQAEDKIKQSELRYRSVIEQASDAICVTDSSFKFYDINPSGCRMLGYSKEEFLQLSIPDLFFSEDLEVQPFKIEELQAGKTIRSDRRCKRKDGAIVEIDLSGKLMEDGRFLMFGRDISERKQAEKLIKESEKRYRQIVETAQEGIWLIDEYNTTVFVNRKMADILEYSMEEMIGKKNYAFMDDESHRNAIEHIKRRKLGINENHDFKYLTKSGKDVWTNLSTNAIFDEDGTYKGALAMITDITERKKAEDRIKDSELRYRSLIEQASDAICIADSSMKFIDMNPSGFRMLGYSKEEFLQLSVADLLLPDDLKTNPFKIEELQTGKAVMNERRLKRRNGTMIDVDINGKILEDGRFIIFARDISERKHADRLIKESELRYRSLIEQATDAICIADASLKFIDVNPYACEFLGYTKEEVLQLSVTDILFPEDLAANPIDKFDTIKSNEIIRNERRFKRKDGSPVIMEVSTRLMEDGRFIMFGHDISDRKKAETILIENEGQLSVAAQIAKLGYWEFDVPSNLFKFNDQFYSIFKTTAEKVGGYTMPSERYASLFVHPDDTLIVFKAAADAIKSPDPHYSNQIEHRIRYANGGVGYMASRFFTVKDAKGRTIKTFGAIQDITENKEREAALLQSEASLDLMNKELELKNKELEHFAYVASHDLQEPLRTTTSFVDLLLQQYAGKLDERADKYIRYIADSSSRMKVLITDLLDYSRIGTKKELQQVDCNTIVAQLIQDLGAVIKETGAKIKVGTLPVINGYRTEMKQLFQNLIVNAIKFRKKDAIPEISISATLDKASWTFTVRDNGIGIAEDHKDRIFVIFQRLHTRSEYEGSGIGLAHCKKIVGLHGGNIWIESTPGEGTTFYFTIPLNNK